MEPKTFTACTREEKPIASLEEEPRKKDYLDFGMKMAVDAKFLASFAGKSLRFLDGLHHVLFDKAHVERVFPVGHMRSKN